MAEEKLENLFIYNGGPELETCLIGEVQLIRDYKGVWHYADSWIEVPGARDLTLTERFRPKFVVAAGDVERVVLPAEAVRAAPGLLGWCLGVGTGIEGRQGEQPEIMVPYEEWQARDRVPGELVAPEYHGTGAERELARAERECREADRALELAAQRRAEVLRACADEMTRQEARRITGLSVGRIQQLIHSDSLNEIERELLLLLQSPRPKSLAAIQKSVEVGELEISGDYLMRRLRELEQRELVERTKRGFKLTKGGREALAEAQEAADRAGSEAEASG